MNACLAQAYLLKQIGFSKLCSILPGILRKADFIRFGQIHGQIFDQRPVQACRIRYLYYNRSDIYLFIFDKIIVSMNTKYFKKATIISLALCLVHVSPAYAYLDPGTGSLLLQGLLGGIAGAAVFIRLYWHRLTSWLGWIKPGENKSESEQ